MRQGAQSHNGLVATTPAPPRPDRRIHRTRRELAKALIELTLEKGFEAVTIRDLTERADIGYATFFRHYPDKEALVNHLLEETLHELLELVVPVSHHPQHSAMLIFEHVQQRPDLHRVLLSLHGSDSRIRQIYAIGIENILKVNKPLPSAIIPPDLAAHHMMASILGLIEWWLGHHMPYPPERMGAIVSALIIEPTRKLAFKAASRKR